MWGRWVLATPRLSPPFFMELPPPQGFFFSFFFLPEDIFFHCFWRERKGERNIHSLSFCRGPNQGSNLQPGDVS